MVPAIRRRPIIKSPTSARSSIRSRDWRYQRKCKRNRNYQKSDRGLKLLCQGHLLEFPQSASNRAAASRLKFLLEDNSGRSTCILLWPCDQCDLYNIKQVQVPKRHVFSSFCQKNQKFVSGGGIPFWAWKSRRKMLAKIKTQDVGGGYCRRAMNAFEGALES